MSIIVRVKNPPYKGNYWKLGLFNTVWGDSLMAGMHIPIDQPITLESLPAGWSFPLYIDIFIYELNVKPYNVFYKIQSAYGSDFPDYKNITLPGHGDYYFNAATKQFELIEPPEVVPCEIFIDAPSSEEEGNRVSASVRVKNVSPYNYSYKATIYAVPDLYPDYIIGSIDQVITSGSSVTRSATFTMPDCNTTVFVWVERWAVDHWVYDNSETKVVSLEVVPEFKGTISKKELEYNESQRTIPVSNVPQGERGLVHIWGRNDVATSQKLGIHWIVSDPDGIVVEDYQDWEFGTTGPGDDHHFIGGRFDINKPGNWTIGISLAMNPSDPVTVDSYIGDLCTVEAAVLEYKGTISKKELEYDETRSIIPVY